MNNKIIGNIEYNNAKITFKGENNIFICQDKLCLENCEIRFTGNNSVIYIDKNDYPISLNMRISNDSVIYIGKDCYTNRTSNLYATERKNIIIGNELLLSFDTYIRTADPHIIYDTKTKKRLNFSKSILIGDHVWIGQESLILKGTYIGSGSIIGGKSVLANKKINSNSLYAGNPVRKIKDDVFYGAPNSTHDFTLEDELKSEKFDGLDNQYVYEKDENTISLEEIDNELLNMKSNEEKIKFIEDRLVNNNYKNRFFKD